MMAGDWQTQSVAELQRLGILLVEDGNHGEYRPRSEEFSSEGVAFIRAADMNDGAVLFESSEKINETARRRITKGIGAPGDVLLSHKGTVGKVAIVAEDAPAFVCSPQTTFWRTRNQDFLDRKYLYAFLRSPAFHRQLATRAGETDMAPYVSLTSQRGLTVTLPPIKLQRFIGRVLAAFDDKIELNRRMNQTLEGMARAIFKSWFVDFDPVRAKAAGKKPTGLSPTIAELFPDSFEDSELGEIPKGWEARPLYDVARFINGAAFKTEDFCESGDGLPVIKIAELKDGIDAQTKFSKRLADPDRLIDTADLLYSWSGSPDTSLDAFLWANGKGLLNQHIFKVVAATTAEKRFVFYLLKYLRPILVETARNKQTTGLGHVTVADMKRLRVCWPSNSILSDFDRTIGPIYEESFLNVLQNRTLAALRDTLLPKLMSGELRVPNAERIAARCI